MRSSGAPLLWPASMALFCLAALAGPCPVAAGGEPGYSGRILRVGPDKPLKTVAAAARAARSGDIVEIDAGVYKGDVATWSASDIVIRGVGGMAHLDAAGKDEGGKGIWVVRGRNVVVENIEFSNAKVRDENGAGIRIECSGLTLRNCYFHDNENGILGGHGDCDILIEHCEFARNGYGDGYSHNMYIGSARSFTMRFSYSHHAKVGHNVKSRARKNVLLYNRIMDEADGNSSYSVDLPNGGLSILVGNLIQQGPRTQNSSIFSYAAEGGKNPDQRLFVVNNTFVNDRGNGSFISIRGSTKAVVANNLFIGNGRAVSGKAEETGNLLTQDARAIVDRAGYDYRLAENSPARDKGTDPGKADDFPLLPVAQYVHKACGEERLAAGPPDIGAYEFGIDPKRKFLPGLLAQAPPATKPEPKPEKRPEPKPEPVAAKPAPPPPPPPPRSPEQICAGWFSMARNYKSAGLVDDAKRCLGNIVAKYPDTPWAKKAREEMARL